MHQEPKINHAILAKGTSILVTKIHNIQIFSLLKLV